ncbi:hypothetical protein C5B85_03110 [Pseudoclavibacter sp. AY1F1]|nr:hypothetical protein C5B85_03110 [Pseudoclavibacter sp. AY1F1]
MLADTGPWHRYLAVARERAVLDEGEWLAGSPRVPSRAASLSAPEGAVELLVEAAPGPGLPLSDLCELFDEIEAPSLPEILDVGMTEQREAVAVLEATLGSSVEELLDRPNPLTAGEIVTILAPLVETLAELHAQGVSLGALSCDDVRLTSAGRPVLKNWHAAARLPEADIRAHVSIVRDWKALESVADLVLAQLPSQTELPAALERELDRCLSGEVDAELGHRLLDALFSWQDAREVHDPSTGQQVPRTAVLAESAAETAASRRIELPEREGGQINAGSLLAGDSDNLGDDIAGSGRAGTPRSTTSRRAQRAQRLSGTRQGFLSGIRIPYRIAAAAAVVMCVCAVSIGLLGREPGEGAQGTGGLAESGVSQDSASAPETVTSPSHALPIAEEAAASPEEPAPDWRAAAAAEDPTAAATALLERRAECLASSPDGCLEEVYQSDAPGLHADLARGEGPAVELAGLTTATLRDRYGDFAVVDLWPAEAVQTAETPPASLTIARGEAGWRLRDVRVT